MLENGKTAQDTFAETLAELQGKVKQLGDDLASQDAHAFLVHSKFLQDKFGNAPLLGAPSLERTLTQPADRNPTGGP